MGWRRIIHLVLYTILLTGTIELTLRGSLHAFLDAHPWIFLPLLAAIPLLWWRNYRAFRRMAG